MTDRRILRDCCPLPAVPRMCQIVSPDLPCYTGPQANEAKVLVGILNLKLELLPQLNQTLTQEVVNAQDENGVNRPVCSYIRPLRAGRLLDTPRQAARFVSLLGYEKAPVVGGGGKQEQWCTLLSFLCQNKLNRALTVVTFQRLLGLMPAASQNLHLVLQQCAMLPLCLEQLVAPYWPRTLVFRADAAPERPAVEPAKTQRPARYIHKSNNPDDPPLLQQQKPTYPYRTIGCVFNHQSFFANCQPSDAVELCEFDFHDESKWKAMSEEAIMTVCARGSTTSLPPFPPLCASVIDSAAASNEIELEIRNMVSEHRKEQERERGDMDPKGEKPVLPQPKRGEAAHPQPTSPPAEEEYLLVPPPSPTAEKDLLCPSPPAEGACRLVPQLQPKGEEPLPPLLPEREEPLLPFPPEGEGPLLPPPSGAEQQELPLFLPPPQPEAEQQEQPLTPPPPGAEHQELLRPPPPPEAEQQELPLPPPPPGAEHQELLLPPPPPEAEQQKLPLPPPPPGAEQQELPLSPPLPEGDKQELPLSSPLEGPGQDASGPQQPLLSGAWGKTVAARGYLPLHIAWGCLSLCIT
ncbi:UNVERIFIED_CONTAM: hypothetical protein FKN15_026351 [Acipenser sinensis]